MTSREDPTFGQPREYLDELAGLLAKAMAAVADGARTIVPREGGDPSVAGDLEAVAGLVGELNARMQFLAQVAADMERLFEPRARHPWVVAPVEEAVRGAIAEARARTDGTTPIRVSFAEPGARVRCDPLDLRACLAQSLSEGLLVTAGTRAPVELWVGPTASGRRDPSNFVTFTVAHPASPAELWPGNGAPLPLRLALEATRRNHGGATRDVLPGGHVRTTLWLRRAESVPCLEEDDVAGLKLLFGDAGQSYDH